MGQGFELRHMDVKFSGAFDPPKFSANSFAPGCISFCKAKEEIHKQQQKAPPSIPSSDLASWFSIGSCTPLPGKACQTLPRGAELRAPGPTPLLRPLSPPAPVRPGKCHGTLIAKLMSIFGNQEQKVIIMGLDNAGEHHSLPVVSDFRAVRVEGWASHQTDRHGDQSLELFPGLQGSSVPGGVIENAAWTFLVLRLLGLAFKSCTVRATLAPTAFLHLPGAPAKPSSRPAKCPNLPSWSSLPLAVGRPFLTPVPSVS
ncbi:putative ADP-ribosylation factor-like protein 5C [Macaca nemestrina]|uniref:putative ADP-ribosylation factor-like protein 5C n=1 Tax=Macaca nemestrina TaxID=9545 RepID=UPI0039B9ACA6